MSRRDEQLRLEHTQRLRLTATYGKVAVKRQTSGIHVRAAQNR